MPVLTSTQLTDLKTAVNAKFVAAISAATTWEASQDRQDKDALCVALQQLKDELAASTGAVEDLMFELGCNIA